MSAPAAAPQRPPATIAGQGGVGAASEAGRRARAAALATLATLATALTLGPLMAGGTWLAPLVVALVATGLAAVAAGLARLPSALQLLAAWVAGIAVCTALFTPERALAGGFVPTPQSLADLRSLVDAGIAVSRSAVAPVAVGPELQALVAVAMVHVAVVVIAVAAGMGHPGLAGLPLLLVLFVAAALSPDGLDAAAFLAAAAGYLALTLTDADRRVSRWGPLLRRRSGSSSSSAPVAASYLPQAVTVGATALVAAVVVPSFVPALGGDTLAEALQERFGDGGIQTVSTVNPFLDLRRDLTRPEDVDVLEYTTLDPTPDPLRIVTLDTYDAAAGTWAPSEPQLPIDQTVDRPLPAPPGTLPDVLAASERVVTEITVTGLEQRYLPLPYPTATIDIEGTWLYDPETLNVLSGTDTTLGKRYVVESYDIRPDGALLAGSPPAPAAVRDRYGAVPEGTPAVVAQTAASVTEGAATAYDRAVALQRFFRSEGGFVYSLDAPAEGGVDIMESFLTERRGYCVQYASTMAVMARTLGIPSRVAVGFLPGEPTGPGVFRVGVQDAHAWPELYFEGAGWVRFEPTPADRTGESPAWAQPDGAEPAPTPTEQATQPSVAPAPAERPANAADDLAAQGGGEAGGWSGARALLVGVGVLALLVALAVAPRTWRDARDRLLWRRAGSDARAVAGTAWVVMVERLADLGRSVGPGTAREQAAAIMAAEEPDITGREALERLVTAVERAWFARTPASPESLRADVATVVGAVRRQRGRWERFRAEWLPSPSPARVAGSAGSVLDEADMATERETVR